MQIFENCRNLCYRVDCIFVGRIYNIYDMAKDATNEELLGSHVQVNNLTVNLNLTIEVEKIEQLIMEYNNHSKSHE